MKHSTGEGVRCISILWTMYGLAGLALAIYTLGCNSSPTATGDGDSDQQTGDADSDQQAGDGDSDQQEERDDGAAFCGDLVCGSGETCDSCPEDCGPCSQICGDGVCTGTEDCDTCMEDCGPCDSTYFYVATDGNDAWEGTKDRPWLTIQHAVDTVPAGSTIRVRAGTYSENVLLNKSGTSDAYITLSNYPGETVVVNGQSGYALRVGGSAGKSYWIIQGITFQTSGESATAMLLSSANWGGTVTDHWIVRGNRMVGGGILIRGNNHLVEGNDIDGQHLGKSGDDYNSGIRDTYGGSGSTPAETASYTHHNTYRNNVIRGFERSGIWTMGYTHDSVIEGNTISDIYGSGNKGQCIDLDGAGTVEWRHVVRGNDVSGCGSEAIQLENTFDSLIENNKFYDSLRCITLINYDERIGCNVGGEGDQYGDTDGDDSCQDGITDNIVRQNILIDCSGGSFVNYSMDGVHYFNNSVYGHPSWTFGDPESHAFEHTEARCNINTLSNLPGTLLAADHNIDAGSAMYVDPGNGDLSLQSGSPAIDAGVDTSAVQNSVSTVLTADFGGDPRVHGAAIDIGAFEYQG